MGELRDICGIIRSRDISFAEVPIDCATIHFGFLSVAHVLPIATIRSDMGKYVRSGR